MPSSNFYTSRKQILTFTVSSSSINKGKGKETSNSKSDLDETDTAKKRKGEDLLNEEKEERERAAAMLGSWEMCAWMGGANGESIPQTRLRLQKRLIGIEEDTSPDEWDDNEARSDRRISELAETRREHNTRKRPSASGSGSDWGSKNGSSTSYHGQHGHH
ncbi:MAG: hypothetical protein Q9225_002955 [Loekoesia sp. 1 TL-2023]